MARAKKVKKVRRRPTRRPAPRRRPPARVKSNRLRRHLADVLPGMVSVGGPLLIGEQKPILLRLPSPLLERIRELAKEDRRSMNRWCELALANAANGG